MEWKGVISAITTPFNADYSVDHAFLADVLPKFVQYIKLVQQEVGKGNERVRGLGCRLPAPSARMR
jgi:hypothetical protein